MANTTRITFTEHGFLSDEVMGWSLKTSAAHPAIFGLVSDVNKEAMKRLFVAKPNKNDSQQLIGALLFGRALQSAQGCFILAVRGMAGDARMLVRSATESAIALQAVAQDESFIDELVVDHERHTLALANSFLNDVQIRSDLSPEDEANLRGVTAAIRDKYKGKAKDGKPPAINWEAIAVRVGMSSVYNTVYREMSGDGAHVTVNALNRHVKADEKSEIQGLSFEPSDAGLVSTICAVVTAMIFAMEALERIFGAKSASSTLEEFVRRLKPIELEIPATEPKVDAETPQPA